MPSVSSVIARIAMLASLPLVACSGGKDAPATQPSPAPPGTDPDPQPAPSTDPDPSPGAGSDAAPAQPPPDFPETTRSLELTSTVGVRFEPRDDARRIGTIAVDTRVAWQRTAKGRGCKKPWVEVKPRGWICSDYVKASKKAPYGREVPMLDRGELVPGTYGKVTAPNSVTYVVDKPPRDPKDKTKKKPADKKSGPVTSPRDLVETAAPATAKPELKLVEGKPLVGSVNVRHYGDLTVGGRTFWKVSQKDQEYVLRQAITLHAPSLYGGARLGDDTGLGLPGVVWPRVYSWGQAYTMYTPTGAGGQNRAIPARTIVPVLETQADKAGKPLAYRIGANEWISAADLRVFNPAPPPPFLEKGERWVDVDLDNQILVAFEGELPVYATLVTTGATATPTQTGVYRIWLKESEADMKGLTGEDPYSVATVPWTQFFSDEKGLALHTAYWHDAFGTRRSHGCVNLAPRDARWLYYWSDPQVAPGWTMAAGIVESPGSIVRVRTKDDPAPPTREYAKKVLEARQQNAPIHR
ncbi:MAG: L,D-transpeptidase family protein [Deltaproteobacteria bacterium]|nr:L,D-transpeptidase family protein [Deltaproteobacteria bacterium]